MLRIDRKERKLTALIEPKLQEAGIAERYDLQRMILTSADVFFGEIKEHLLLIGEEIQPSDMVGDRIDILAIDRSGEIVIIELKRGREKLQMLQAISYASMVADWKPADFIRQLAEFQQIALEDATQKIEEFLDEGNSEILNKGQRIVLCAEEFDYALLMSARWLSQQYGLGIRCYRVSLASDEKAEYLACLRIFPPPELEDNARRARLQAPVTRAGRASNWEEAIAEMQNPDVADFFRQQLAQGRKQNIIHQSLSFYIGDMRAFSINGRKQFARVVQKRRFENDIEFWRARISDKEEIDPIDEGQELRFYLKNKADLDCFLKTYEEFKLNRPKFQTTVAQNMDSGESSDEN